MPSGAVEPVTLSWNNLSYVVDSGADKDGAHSHKTQGKGGGKDKDKGKGGAGPREGSIAAGVNGRRVILDNLSGQVTAGQCLAIIGPSGSGKTSLLNVLSRRISEAAKGSRGAPGRGYDGRERETRLDVRVNGERTTEELSRRFGAFVPQEDVLPGTLTVREAIRFNATLRLSQLSEEDRERRIDNVIKELGLTKVADSLIGFTGQDALNSGLKRSLSGGERKRVSIALELVTEPSLLYLDEPTSGLDSYASLSIVNSLLHLARRSGRTVVFTIHQPSDEIFEQLDQLLILGMGNVIYQGPASEALSYFDDLGYHCPRHENPADYLLRIVHIDDRGRNAEEEALAILEGNSDAPQVFEVAEKQVLSLTRAFRGSDAENALRDQWDEDVSEAESRRRRWESQSKAGTAAVQSSRPGFFLQGRETLKRSLRNLVREPMQLIGTAFQAIFFALIIALLFGRLGDNQRNVRDRMGVIFFSTIFLFFNALFQPVFLFGAEQSLFRRQHQNGILDIVPYFIFRFIAEIPKLVTAPIAFSSVFYFIVNLNSGTDRFLLYVLVLIAQSYAGFTMGLFIVTMVPDPAVALAIMPILFIPLLLLAGMLIAPPSIPVFMKPFEYITFTRYSFHALMFNEFDGAEFTCTDEELEINNGSCPWTTGEIVLEVFGFNESGFSFGVNVLILVALAVVFHIAAFFFLYRNTKKK